MEKSDQTVMWHAGCRQTTNNNFLSLLSSPVLGVRLMTALQVLQVLLADWSVGEPSPCLTIVLTLSVILDLGSWGVGTEVV